MWDSLLHTPYWGLGLQPRCVPWLGLEPVTHWFAGLRSVHWATPARARLLPILVMMSSQDSCVNLFSPRFCLILPRPAVGFLPNVWEFSVGWSHLYLAVRTVVLKVWSVDPQVPETLSGSPESRTFSSHACLTELSGVCTTWGSVADRNRSRCEKPAVWEARHWQGLKNYKVLSLFLLNKLFLENDSYFHEWYLCEQGRAWLSF